MAQGLMGLQDLLGQSSNASSGGLLGGGVFSQPESRGRRRSRLLSEAISGAGRNPYGQMGAAIGGLLGMAGRSGAEALGIVDKPPEVQQAEAIRQVQQEAADRGLNVADDPREFGDFVASRFQELGQPQLATRSLLQARQIESEFAPEPVETERVIRGGTPEGDAAGLSEGESAIGTYVDGKRTSLKNRQTIDKETPPSRIREYEIALQRDLINPDTSLEEYNQIRAGGGRSSVTPTETQLKPYASVISSNEDLNERIRSLVKNADPATLGDFNIPFTGGRDQDAVDAVSLQAQQRAAEIRNDNAELTIEQALEQAIDELSQGRGKPTPDENASGGQAGTATPQNDAFAGRVNP